MTVLTRSAVRLGMLVGLQLVVFTVPAKARAGQTDASDSRIKLGDREFYSKGRYVAFAAPWCADGKKDLVVGRDISGAIVLDSGRFPAQTSIVSRAPDVSPNVHGCGVYAYNHIAFGNYNGGIPKTAVAPVQISSIRRLTASFSLHHQGQGEYNVLQEFFLRSSISPPGRQVAELGFFQHASASAITFAKSGKRYADYRDSEGRVWHVYRKVRYFMFFPAKGDLSSGRMDMHHVLEEMVRRRLLKGTEWFTGMAIGVEPVTGQSSLTVRQWDIFLE